MLQSDETVNGRPAKPSYRYSGHLPTAFQPHIDRRCWLCWNYVWSERQGKWTKPPHSAFTGRVCSATNPQNFGTFDQAVATMRVHGLAGIGFALLKADGLTGIDLDDALTDGGLLKTWAAEILQAGETYAEISPSGEGLHIIAAGKIAEGFKNDQAGVEAYVERRYLTFTGDLWEDAPDAILPAPQTLAAVEKHRPQRGRQRQQSGTGDTPFDRLNAVALDKLEMWVPRLFPTAHNKYPPTWRVPAKDLGDSYEEDLVCGPNGIRYFGSGKGFNPLTLVQEYGPVDGARSAARWLYENIGVDPVRLGFFAEQRARTGAGDEAPAGSESQLPRGYFMQAPEPGKWAGLHWKNPNDTEASSIFVCAPIAVLGRARDPESSGWARVVTWTDPDNRQHVHLISDAKLHGDVPALCGELAELGLQVTDKSKDRKYLVRFLNRSHPKTRITIVDCTGWHHTTAGDVFVLPDHVFGDADVMLRIAPKTHAYKAKGTLQQWKDSVAAVAVGNTRLMFGICVALAGPLLQITGQESGGFHLVGPSSIGKSTALRLASSVWGGPPRAYLITWRTTDNALEATAVFHSDTFLALDELSQVGPRAAGAAAYMIANGQGKGRAQRDGSARERMTWRVVFLSTGEQTLADKIAEDHRYGRPRAGQHVRMVDVPADAGKGHGVFDVLPENVSGRAFADQLCAAADRYYGTAAPVFIEDLLNQLNEDASALRTAIEKSMDAFVVGLELGDAHGQVRRVARRFAFVAAAGELAVEYEVLPWTKEEVQTSVKACFEAWRAEWGDGHDAIEVAQALEKVRRYFERYGTSRFQELNPAAEASTYMGDPAVPDRAGFRVEIENHTTWFVFPETWAKEILAGFDVKSITRIMADRGIVIREETGNKLQVRKRLPGLGRQRVYQVTDAVLAVDRKTPEEGEADA